MKKVLVILSGGLDSTTALYWALSKYNEVGAISFNYGSKHNQLELERAKLICETLKVKHKIVKMPLNGILESHLMIGGEDIPEGKYNEENMTSTVVPFRNGIFLSIAAGFAESRGYEGIILGNHTGDHVVYKDCRPDFIDKMKAAIMAGTNHEISLISPFCFFSKSEIVKIGSSLNVDFSLTYSCYNGGDKHCGKCATCLERKDAFIQAGIKDATIYEN